MQVWRPLIAVIFAVAAVVGAALSGASVAQAAPAAPGSLQAASCEVATTAGSPAAPAFHPCGKLRNGLAIQCHLDAAVLPATASGSDPIAPVVRDLARAPAWAPGFDSSLFRPPRATA